MPIIQRGKAYQVTINSKGHRLRKQFESDSQAIEFESEVKALILQGIPLNKIDPDRILSKSLPISSEQPTEIKKSELFEIQRWNFADTAWFVFDDRWKGTASERTMLINVKVLVAHFGTDYLDEIDEDAIQKFVWTLSEKNNSGSTINRKLTSLRVILDTALKLRRLDRLPFFPRQKETIARPRYLTEEDVSELIGKAKFIGKPDLADAIIIAVTTGIRQGNLLSMRKHNVDLEERVIRFTAAEVKNKGMSNAKGYSVPLTAKALEVMKRRIENTDGDYLFPMTNNSLGHHWKHLQQVHFQGARNYRWHDLRHTFASWMVQRGVDIASVSRLMNHSSIQMTMRYAYLAPSNYHEKVACLDDAI